jgi:nucleotide-binding universal stress UspA family protein
MIKHILVPTDGSDQADIGVRYAVDFAQDYQATLHGLHVVDIKLLEGPFLRDISASLGTAPYVNYEGNISLILEERGRAALDAFRRVCEAAGATCETILDTGLVVRTILERAELSDLIVLGRTGEHGKWLEGLMGSTTEGVARRSDRPVLVTGTQRVGREKLLVAYDGTAHAKEALHVAADFGVKWSAHVSVVVVGIEHGDALLAEAQSYLQAFELETSYLREEGDEGERIMHTADTIKADLLVMGAYGHSKVRELVVGSTTAYALNHAGCPILLTR